MNLKKGLLRSIVMGAVLIGAISINSHVQATQDESDAILLGKYGVDKVKNSRMVNFES